jgi:hypothetical protein
MATKDTNTVTLNKKKKAGALSHPLGTQGHCLQPQAQDHIRDRAWDIMKPHMEAKER